MADLIGFLVANPSASVPEDGVDNDLRQYAKLAEEEPSSQWELGDGQIPLLNPITQWTPASRRDTILHTRFSGAEAISGSRRSSTRPFTSITFARTTHAATGLSIITAVTVVTSIAAPPASPNQRRRRGPGPEPQASRPEDKAKTSSVPPAKELLTRFGNSSELLNIVCQSLSHLPLPGGSLMSMDTSLAGLWESLKALPKEPDPI